MSNLDPLFLDIFGPSKNVHFALCAPPILNMKRETPKMGGCDHYAHKTHFSPLKTVTELFWGVGGCVHFEGGKIGHLCIGYI